MKCHVNIRWSTEVCIILTKKSLSPFSFSSFSFPLFPSFSFCSPLPHFSFFPRHHSPPPGHSILHNIYPWNIDNLFSNDHEQLLRIYIYVNNVFRINRLAAATARGVARDHRRRRRLSRQQNLLRLPTRNQKGDDKRGKTLLYTCENTDVFFVENKLSVAISTVKGTVVSDFD